VFSPNETRVKIIHGYMHDNITLLFISYRQPFAPTMNGHQDQWEKQNRKAKCLKTLKYTILTTKRNHSQSYRVDLKSKPVLSFRKTEDDCSLWSNAACARFLWKWKTSMDSESVHRTPRPPVVPRMLLSRHDTITGNWITISPLHHQIIYLIDL
jgi:hypothetical protein